MNLDTAIGPYAGPCACCGRPDKRHRMFDAIRGSHRAGDSIEMLSDVYGRSPEAIEWIVSRKRFPRLARIVS